MLTKEFIFIVITILHIRDQYIRR